MSSYSSAILFSPWGIFNVMLTNMFFLIMHIPVLVVFKSLSCVQLCDPMDCSMPGFHVLHHFLELDPTHAHLISDAIQPCCPLSSPSPPAPNPSQHQGLFQ